MLTIPWFPKQLKANSRHQHRYIGNVKNKYKQDCYLIAKSVKPFTGDTLTIIFHPPDRRRRDLDNCLASIKYGLDGICDAWGIDDYQFTKQLIIRAEPVKGGEIVIKEGMQ